MPKQREKNDKEYYQGIIRELKAEVKRLKQQVKRLERKEHYHETVKEEPEDDVQYENYEELCPECGKGKLIEHTIAGRYWVSCDTCKYRTKAKKI